VKTKITEHKTISLLALLLASILVAGGCQSREERSSQVPPLKLSLAIQAVPHSGLIAIADDKGFFKEAGLEVSIKAYPSGLSALEAVCRGEAQMATVADIAFVGKTNEEPSLRIVASIGLSTGNKIVARKDRNILKPSDLKGKRVGFSPNTTCDYFLDMFLLANTMSRSEVNAVSIPSASQVEAVVSGEVDAVSAFDVYAYEAEKRLGANAVSWAAQNYLGYHWLLAVKESLTQSPEPIKRFLRALMKAENFLLAHEDEAKSIVTRNLGLDPEFMQQVWDKTTINVTLNQSLLTSLDNFARWKMNKEGKPGNLPNYLNYIYAGALDEIDHRAVTIFR
jgi:NitT/TauT family transport system substrate-binding protein